MSARSCGSAGFALALSSLGLLSLQFLLQRPSADEHHPPHVGRPLLAASSWAHTKDVKASLSDVLHDAVGGDKEKRIATDVRIDRLQEALRPMYAALPKNMHGRVEHSTVRYALHRFFVHRHAMYIKGLEPTGEAWNISSAGDILVDQLPAYVQHHFEERLHDGMDLRDLAIFAAALEHIIHGGVVDSVGEAYRVLGLSLVASINATQLEDVLDVCMMIQLRGPGYISHSNFEAKRVNIAKIYNFWPGLQAFMREVLVNTLEEDGMGGALIPVATAVKVAQTVQERFGRWQDADCRSMAKELGKLEIPGTGRVKLSDFYSSTSRRTEAKAYLKDLGALDDSIPSQPRVIIANYMTSPTNCVGSAGLFSTCCIDQCEELIGHLERSVAKPAASVKQMLELVSALPSPTVVSPRKLSNSLIERLDEIAALHDGRVPLHGRLFAQWLHHAYPLECPFPHKAGTTKPRTGAEWRKETGMKSSVVSWQELASVKDLVDGDLHWTWKTLPWSTAEELVARHSKPTLLHELSVVLRALMFLAALFSGMLVLASVLRLEPGIEAKLVKV